MNNIAIKVENLGKKYIINHESGTSDDNFREVFVGNTKKILKTLNPLRKEPKQKDTSKEEFWALNDVGFEINKGDKVGIIGRNGAGKSTLLKVLSRIAEPTTGKIHINGRIASLLEVGTGFHPELTGRENIFLNGAILGMSRAEIREKFDDIVAFAEVYRFLDTPVKRYSSGMYVRLAFAVAAHLDPEILIVDEVLAVGDAVFQKKCLEKMDEVSKQGRTVIFVSHDLQTISTLTDKVIVLNVGKVIFSGSTKQGIVQYLQLNQERCSSYTSTAVSDTVPTISDIHLKTSLPNNVQENGKIFSIMLGINMPGYEEGIAIAVHIKDMTGRGVLHQSVFDSEQQICRNIGKNRVELIFPKLKLYSGLYCITVHLAQTEGTIKYDTVSEKCTFEVVLYNKNHGYKWQEGVCCYLEDVTWKSNDNTMD